MCIHHFIHRARTLLLVLCLAAVVSAWAPAPQQQRWDGNLGISIGSLSGGQSICRGEDYTVKILVQNVTPGLEIPLPVNEAAVQVTDNQGRRFADFTNRFGQYTLHYPTDKDGEYQLTINANKQYYVDAQPYKINLRVRSCRWTIEVDFLEEYNIISDFTVVVGAHVKWDGQLEAGEARGEESVSKVELLGGSGRYNLYAYDHIKAPFHVTMEPEVHGDFTIHMGGYMERNNLNLEMGNDPVSYPKVVNLRLKDYSNRGIEVKYAPPVTTGGGNGLIFDMMKIYNFVLPTGGGTMTYTSGGYGVFFQLPDRKEYELTIRLRPYEASEHLQSLDLPFMAWMVR